MIMKFESTRIDDLVGGDAALKKEFLELYFATYQKVMNDCKKAYEKNDQRAWHDAVHELKGSSMNLGFEEMSNLCKKFELHAGDPAEKKDFIFILESNLEEFRKLV